MEFGKWSREEGRKERKQLIKNTFIPWPVHCGLVLLLRQWTCGGQTTECIRNVSKTEGGSKINRKERQKIPAAFTQNAMCSFLHSKSMGRCDLMLHRASLRLAPASRLIAWPFPNKIHSTLLRDKYWQRCRAKLFMVCKALQWRKQILTK